MTGVRQGGNKRREKDVNNKKEKRFGISTRVGESTGGGKKMEVRVLKVMGFRLGVTLSG